MDKKNNMKQAMYEMFGVGSEPVQEPKKQAPQPVIEKEDGPVVKAERVQPAPKPVVPATYIAPGTVMEGTLRAAGDVEVAGDVKGDITTPGTVTLDSDIQGNIVAGNLKLTGCTLTGDVTVDGVVLISLDSRIVGNIIAKELECAGKVKGDLKVTENTTLEGTAQINGNIATGSLAVAKGAVIKGGIEMNGAGK